MGISSVYDIVIGKFVFMDASCGLRTEEHRSTYSSRWVVIVIVIVWGAPHVASNCVVISVVNHRRQKKEKRKEVVGVHTLSLVPLVGSCGVV